MARQESNREDILREATALVDRVELQCDGWDEPIVCGFRRQGVLSLFVGQDEVYQFDSHQALRRAYWQGYLLKADGGRLVQLRRQRSRLQTLLLRHELTAAEAREHLERLEQQVTKLRESLHDGRYRQLGEVSGTGNTVVERVIQWLDQFPMPPRIASIARVH